jgi:hypothetical protein
MRGDPKNWDPNKDPSPWAKCADGFEISIQARRDLYCSPRENRGDFEGDYTKVEIACLPQPELDEEAREGGLSSGESVYAYVDVGIVNAILKRHGGVIENAQYLPPGVKPGYQENWLAERWEALLGQPL